MDQEREMGPRFARLQASLGAWTLGGVSALMFLGDSPVLGVVFAFVTLVLLMVAVSGMPTRKRPYRRIELLALWIGFPLVGVTFVLLAAVGFLPQAHFPWLAIYIGISALIFVLMIIEANKQKQSA